MYTILLSDNLYHFPVYSDTCTRWAGVLTGGGAQHGRCGYHKIHVVRGTAGAGRAIQYGRCGLHNTHVVGGAVLVYIMNAVRRTESLYTGRGLSGVSCIDPTPYRGKLRYFNVLKWEENAKNPPTLSGKRAFFAKSGGKYHVFPPLSRILL